MAFNKFWLSSQIKPSALLASTEKKLQAQDLASQVTIGRVNYNPIEK